MPTAVITGPGSYSDTYLSKLNPERNYGALPLSVWLNFHNSGDTAIRTGLIQISSAAIPTGPLTAARWSVYRRLAGFANGEEPGEFKIYRLAKSWIEGRGVGADVLAGEPDWNHNVHASQGWSSPGARGVGTDLLSGVGATVVFPNAVGDVGRRDISLPSSWFEAWKTGATTNYGWATRTKTEGEGDPLRSGYRIYPGDDPTFPAWVELDFAPGGGPGAMIGPF